MMSAVPKIQWNLTPAKAALALVLLGWIVYANSLTKSFQYDDNLWIVHNPTLRDWLTNVRLYVTRPTVALSLTANAVIGGLSPASFHAVNLAIHIIAGLTFFGVVRRTLLLPRWNHGWDHAATPLAFAAAAIWIVHPLNTHAVTYVIQRCESGMGMFFVLALYCMIRGSASDTKAWYFASMAAAWAGVGCKEVMVTILPVSLMYDRVFLSKSWAEVVRRRWGLYLGFAATFALPLRPMLINYLFPREFGDTSAGFGIAGLGPQQYLSTQLTVLPYYLKLAVWPTNLCFDYRDWPIASGLRQNLFAAIVATALFLTFLFLALRGCGLAFCGLGVFLVLSVSSSIMPLRDVANEYRMYVPLMFLTTLAVVGSYAAINRWWPAVAQRPWVFTLVIGFLALTLGVLTMIRNEDYRTPVTLWQDVLDKRPANTRSHFFIGYGYEMEGKPELAKEAFQRCLADHPGDNATLLHLAMIQFQEGDTPAAMKLLAKAMQNIDLNIDAESYLASYAHFQGKSEEAIKALDYVKSIRPNRPLPRFHRAGILLDLGRTEEAKQELAEVVALAPGWVDRVQEFANSRLRGAVGDVPGVRREALFYATIAHAARPDESATLTLADALAWNGRPAEAIALLRQATQTPAIVGRIQAMERK